MFKYLNILPTESLIFLCIRNNCLNVESGSNLLESTNFTF